MTNYTTSDITGTGTLHRAVCDDNLAAMKHLRSRGEAFDFIFVDPPYNTGRMRDAYRNRWGEEEWISHVSARLSAAWDLMADDAVMLITIDGRSLSKMLVMVETVLPKSAWHQIVSVSNLPSGTSMKGFRRSNEFYIFVHKGTMAPEPVHLADHWGLAGEDSTAGTIRWDRLLKSGIGHTPESSPGCFYPVYLDRSSGRVLGIGDAVDPTLMAAFTDPEPHVATCWPIRKDGSLGRWRVSAERARDLLDRGLVSVGRIRAGQEERTAIKYLMEGIVARIEAGEIDITGYDPATGVAQLDATGSDRKTLPSTMWTPASHSYSAYGSWLLRRFVPAARFSHPKSIYAMEDALRFYLHSRPKARLLDIYAGSGTTAHALMLLNATDSGQRQSTSITINETPPLAGESEADGVFYAVLLPRLQAALSGRCADGSPVAGQYYFPDRRRFADGLPGTLQVWTTDPAQAAKRLNEPLFDV